MKRTLLRAGFAAYVLLMLWLLFIRQRGIPVTDYWSQLPGRVNLIPFSSMGQMLRTLWRYPRPDVAWLVVYNIGGNIAMLVPLGFFLRALFPRCRKFLRCMAAAAVIMTAVELVQLFTLRGFCEVDDLILNLTGAAIGWWIAKKAAHDAPLLDCPLNRSERRPVGRGHDPADHVRSALRLFGWKGSQIQQERRILRRSLCFFNLDQINCRFQQKVDQFIAGAIGFAGQLLQPFQQLLPHPYGHDFVSVVSPSGNLFGDVDFLFHNCTPFQVQYTLTQSIIIY